MEMTSMLAVAAVTAASIHPINTSRTQLLTFIRTSHCVNISARRLIKYHSVIEFRTIIVCLRIFRQPNCWIIFGKQPYFGKSWCMQMSACLHFNQYSFWRNRIMRYVCARFESIQSHPSKYGWLFWRLFYLRNRCRSSDYEPKNPLIHRCDRTDSK